MKGIAKSLMFKLGYEVSKTSSNMGAPVEITADERDLVEFIKNKELSMVSYERLWNTLLSCKYASEYGVKGDFVECGVWRGGNAIIAAYINKKYAQGKKVWLFDTFKGMTRPTSFDIKSSSGMDADQKFRENQKKDRNDWCFASLNDVKTSLHNLDLLDSDINFVEGDVCSTLNKDNLPDLISVLRLDTDWYESTKKELEVLYPRLEIGGVLIIDDYGNWAGSKKATDEYFEINGGRPFLQYIDSTGRSGVKR